ncbi:MAG: GTP pyrophosphokinase family protein [Christensenellaceae bacterium]|nr:GTP pyrophosphokinase family protein [Christensenellaceae bacterium]
MELIFEHSKPFLELLNQYDCALLEIETKLNVLNKELAFKGDQNPIDSIKSRLKQPRSIIKKLQTRGFTTFTIEDIKKNILDIAGIRVVCPFPEDVYKVAEALVKQDDVDTIIVKDYIKNPKPNGYRSLHVIAEVPVFLSKSKIMVPVEIQFRTIAMNFWASLEHRMHYKKSINKTEIYERLSYCAEQIANMDLTMQQIRADILNME